jgi:hypothetical protein
VPMTHRPTVVQFPLGPCDCLNWCGDDARVGHSVRECEAYRTRRLQAERAARMHKLLQELGCIDALQAVERLHAITYPATAAATLKDQHDPDRLR